MVTLNFCFNRWQFAFVMGSNPLLKTFYLFTYTHMDHSVYIMDHVYLTQRSLLKFLKK